MPGSYDTLISAPELALAVSRREVRVIDCRASLSDPEAGIREFRAGHIPGAQHADLERDLSGPGSPGNGGRHPLPERTLLAQRFRHWGINGTSQIVCYDDTGGAFAARFWWLARWLGHSSVAVLDGGLGFWLEQAGNSLELGDSTPLPSGNFTAASPLTRQIDAKALLNLIQPDPSDSICLIDARGRERFDGSKEPIDPVAGHIPGALCLPFTDNLQLAPTATTPPSQSPLQPGCFKSQATLRSQFESILDPHQRAICYCGSGVTATHHVLALKRAGFPEATLYPGSWSEWIENPERPTQPPRSLRKSHTAAPE